MKLLTLVVSILLLVNMAHGQYRDDFQEAANEPVDEATVTANAEQPVQWGELTGPEAKNHPTWKYANSRPVVTTIASEQKQGPAAKNHKVWEKQAQQKYVPVVTKPRKDLKGPRFKNRRPGH